MRARSLFALVLVLAAVPARAEVRSLTVGVHTDCPYGLVA
jgi:hypothetical protein